MDLSIIVLNYKQKGLVKYCLKNLLSLSLPILYEIIVVDNASADGLATMLKNEFMSVKLVQAEANRGYAAGNNLGIKAAQGKYILVLNPDVYLSQHAILGLIDFMEKNPQAGMVGPKVLNPDNTLQYTCLNFPDWHLPFFRRTILGKTKAGQDWLRHYQMQDENLDQPIKAPWLYGACLMISQSALNKVGLLDERYFLYLEDLDWCRRFWENNFEVWYNPLVSAIHFHQRLSAESGFLNVIFSRPARIHLTSWLKYYWKFHNRPLPKID